MFPTSKLLFKALRRDLAIEPLGVLAIVIDHELASHPIEPTPFGAAQASVDGVVPPVPGGTGRASRNAGLPVPLARPRPEPAEPGRERGALPVGLHQPAPRGPVVRIPQARVHSHALLVRERDPFPLVVSKNADWDAVHVPPEIKRHAKIIEHRQN